MKNNESQTKPTSPIDQVLQFILCCFASAIVIHGGVWQALRGMHFIPDFDTTSFPGSPRHQNT